LVLRFLEGKVLSKTFVDFESSLFKLWFKFRYLGW
jgi:hypothetical protein